MLGKGHDHRHVNLELIAAVVSVFGRLRQGSKAKDRKSEIKCSWGKEMRTKKVKAGIAYCVSLISLFSVFATFSYAFPGGKIEGFSAENVEISKDGKIMNKSMLYLKPGAMRIDGMPGMGRDPNEPDLNISMLVLQKENKQYIYNHDKKLVFESSVDEKNLKAGYKAMDNIESEKVLGKEKVAGYKCVKKEVVTSYKMMGMNTKHKVIVWESDKFDLPLRTQDEDGTIQEMRNIKKGNPPKKYFTPLQGYKQVSNMMAVMGMDFGKMMEEDSKQDQPEEKATPASNEMDQQKSPSQDSDVDLDAIEKTIQGIGNKLKNFKFGN